jgi:ethanolaminephosphotransferase
VPGVCAWGIFVYQTLDALDGKQARRTGTSSPLGQLFDHGCDALAALFSCVVLAGTLRLGASPWLTLNMLFNVFAAFYLGQLEEYQTGVLFTNNGVIGVTEGQVAQICVELATAWGGAGIWDLLVGDYVTLRSLFLGLGTLLTLWVSVSSLYRIFLQRQHRCEWH